MLMKSVALVNQWHPILEHAEEDITNQRSLPSIFNLSLSVLFWRKKLMICKLNPKQNWKFHPEKNVLNRALLFCLLKSLHHLELKLYAHVWLLPCKCVYLLQSITLLISSMHQLKYWTTKYSWVALANPSICKAEENYYIVGVNTIPVSCLTNLPRPINASPSHPVKHWHGIDIIHGTVL